MRIIAEAGVNHNGSLEMALKLVDAATLAGADVIKFQTFRSSELAAVSAPKAQYQVVQTGDSESQLDLIRKLELQPDDFAKIRNHCAIRGIEFLSTPFDTHSIQLLCDLGVKVGKIPSGEATNKPYLEAMARAFPEILLSTGMCDWKEVDDALGVLRNAGGEEQAITVLHCTTEYPAPLPEVNLMVIPAMRERYSLPVGYSDHTDEIEVALAAVALGACVIEKHLTLDRNLPGPDHRASLEPRDFQRMILGIRKVATALGTAEKGPTPSELENRAAARRSIHVARSLKRGHVCTREDFYMLRPGTGLSPMLLETILGKSLAIDIPIGTQLQETHLVSRDLPFRQPSQ